ncbi:hypothetical protein niasHS_006250 [Heterodera schachtii]|uniref:Uncharacterized protein n=1 Tax=Heterodera schachtii TaxID=97005 RepID=A0ABD2JSZ7_HETSC
MANFLPEFVLSVEFASDPSAWETQLEKSWTRLEELLEITAGRFGRDSLDKVCELLSTICHLLVMEVNSQSEPSIGPILDQFFNEEILLKVQRWATKVPSNARPKCQMVLIRLYEYMLTSSQCPQSLLVHKPILTPLLQLLQWCRRSSLDEQRMTINATKEQQQRRRPMTNGVDRCFVRLINQICRKIAADDTLLHFFFHSAVETPCDSEEAQNGAPDNRNGSIGHHYEQFVEGGQGPTTTAMGGDQRQTLPRDDWGQHNGRTAALDYSDEHTLTKEEKKPFLVFDLLVPFLYAPEDVGQLARDALLLIISLSEQHQFVADYVAQKSNFCPVLAAGLSGCFSQLPHCIFTELCVADMDEFHKLSVMDAKTLPELCDFHNALLFCNSVASVAHLSIVRQIVRFFYDGFLLKVFKSSVLEPLLTTYLLYVDALKSRPLSRITKLIADLKEQIDAFARDGSSSASSFIGDAVADFEQMVRRAVRHRQTRAERSERLMLHYHHNQQQHFGGGAAAATTVPSSSVWATARGHPQQQPSTSSAGGGATFRFTHRAMASTERGHLEEQERTRNFAYAAIAHSQLCLLMAAFALQHSAAVEYPRGAR